MCTKHVPLIESAPVLRGLRCRAANERMRSFMAFTYTTISSALFSPCTTSSCYHNRRTHSTCFSTWAAALCSNGARCSLRGHAQMACSPLLCGRRAALQARGRHGVAAQHGRLDQQTSSHAGSQLGQQGRRIEGRTQQGSPLVTHLGTPPAPRPPLKTKVRAACTCAQLPDQTHLLAPHSRQSRLEST
jgi:hypothetical protein